MRWSLSQNCSALGSEIRARTGRVGLLQSDASMGSQTTRTVRLTAFSRFSSSSVAEAPRKQPGHVGDSRSTKRALSAAPANWCLNSSMLFAVRYVRVGWLSGVRADHRKCQPSKSAKATATKHSMYFLFAIRTCSRLTSYHTGNYLRK
jgi:hypothetical protein